MLTKEIVSLAEENVCHHNHTLKICTDARDTKVLTPDKDVAPKLHDIMHDDAVTLIEDEGMTSEDHNTETERCNRVQKS